MKHFKNILVAVDSDAPDSPALHQAVALAVHNQARLKLVDVVREFGWLKRMISPSSEKVIEQLTEDKSRKLEEKAERLRSRGINVTARVLHGKSSVAITREVHIDGHDVAIRDAKGKTAGGTFFGVTGMRLLRQCPCPVWLTRPDGNQEVDRVLAAVDVSAPDQAHLNLNRRILELASSLAERKEAELKVVYAWDIYGESLLRAHMSESELAEVIAARKHEVEERFDQFAATSGLTTAMPNVFACKGDAGQVIPRIVAEENVDLLVMGTVARGGISGAIMGNTAEMILNQVQCSVVAIKPDDFISPVTI